MTNRTTEQTELRLSCSFCGKENKEVELLIAGPVFKGTRICICNECISICSEIINAEIYPLKKYIYQKKEILG